MFKLQYPMILTKGEDGGYIVEISHPNGRFQGVTEGDNFEQAMEKAHHLLNEIVISAIEDGDDIPSPNEFATGTHSIVVPPLTAAKAILYLEMKKQGIKKATLARRLQCDPKQVDRIIQPRHKSTFVQMQSAFAAVGKEMVVSAKDVTMH